MKYILVLLSLVLLGGCTIEDSTPTPTTLEMTIGENYSLDEPFIDARLFYVTDDMTLELNIDCDMIVGNATVEIYERDTNKVLWKENYKGKVVHQATSLTLDVKKDVEYCIQFTGTNVKEAKVVLSTDSDNLKERAQPLKK